MTKPAKMAVTAFILTFLLTTLITRANATETAKQPSDDEIIPIQAAELPILDDIEPLRYHITAEERKAIEGIVMAEAGGESYEGAVLVAQCILNASEHEGVRPLEAMEMYQYTSKPVKPTAKVTEAVAAVFDDGETVTDEPILFFYAPARVQSEWHETQEFVIEKGGHRFFALKL